MPLGGDRPGVGGLPGLSWVWALGVEALRRQNYKNFCVSRASSGNSASKAQPIPGGR